MNIKIIYYKLHQFEPRKDSTTKYNICTYINKVAECVESDRFNFIYRVCFIVIYNVCLLKHKYKESPFLPSFKSAE